MERDLEREILNLVRTRGGGGITRSELFTFFEPWRGRNKELLARLTGWKHLSDSKRGSRLGRILNRMIKAGDLMTDQVYGEERLVPPTILDKIVWAIEKAEADESC